MPTSKQSKQKLDYSMKIDSFLTNEESDSFKIRGIAINETTTRNGHKFVAAELSKAASTLVGRPLLKDHINSVDAIVGKVISATYSEQERAVIFEAEVTDKGLQEKIRQGTLSTVSIGAFANMEEEMDEEGNLTGNGLVQDIDFVELSLVAVPADPQAGFARAIAEKFNFTHTVEESTDSMEEMLMAETNKIEELRAEREKLELELEELRLAKAKAEKEQLEASLQVVEEAEVEEPAAEAPEQPEVEVEDKTEGEVEVEVAEESFGNYFVEQTGGAFALSASYDSIEGLTSLRRK